MVAMDAFISSLISGYEAERDAAAACRDGLAVESAARRRLRRAPDTPQQACLEAVRQADVVILILGARDGAVQPSGVSATHEEWQEAVGFQRPVLVFVESVAEREPAQQQLVDEVQDWAGGRFRESFRSAEELRDR